MVKHAKTRSSPSTSAQAKQMLHKQQPTNVDAMYNGRPTALSPTPIWLYHPVFSQFSRDMLDNSELTEKELRAASNLISVSSEYYETETDRVTHSQAAWARVLPDYGFWPQETTFNVGPSSVKPDGVAWTMCSGHDATILRLVMEFKNEMGEAECDPLAQAECVYIAVTCSDQV